MMRKDLDGIGELLGVAYDAFMNRGLRWKYTIRQRLFTLLSVSACYVHEAAWRRASRLTVLSYAELYDPDRHSHTHPLNIFSIGTSCS